MYKLLPIHSKMAVSYNTDSRTLDQSTQLDSTDPHRRTSAKIRRLLGQRSNLKMALVVVMLLCLCSVTSGLQNHMDTNDIQSFLDALKNPEVASQAAAEQKTQLQSSSSWGILDKSASLGKLFQYSLPTETVNGNYEVKELGKDSLPSWLTFDASIGLLQGVPGTEQLDQEYFLEVTSPSNDVTARVSDVFSVKVLEDKVHLDTAASKLAETQTEGIRPIKCPPGSSVTVATIIVDVDLGAMMPEEKVGMMRGMCSHLSLPDDVLKVMPVGDKPMFDSSALVAGPGDVKQPQKSGAVIQWEVGCGNVHAHHMPILQQLETSSSDGSMSKAVEQGIVGWHVTNNKPHAPIRLKRQAWVRPTPTPVPTGTPPTKRPVPTMTSPVLTDEIHPTETHKKHRTKTHGRHDHKTKHPKGTKKPRKSKKTKRPKQTPAPTATDQPIQPTRTADVMPTEIVPTASPGVSRTIGVIEPSMRPTQTWPTPTTDPLSSQTPQLPGGTDVPQPTQTDTEKPPTKAPPGSTPQPTRPVHPDGKNFEPILGENDIKRLQLEVGEILDFKIPSQTFHDREDGSTENLKLILESIDGLNLPRSSWLKFNSTTQKLFGLPMPEHIGRQEYAVVAIDSGGKIARDPFEIVVVRRPHDHRISHEFRMTIDMDYDEFSVDVNKRIEVASKLASVYGDTDMSKITVTRIDRGSVIYAWVNNSIPTKPCPVDAITHLLQFLVTENETLNETFLQTMRPYRVLKAGAVPKGSCDPATTTLTPTEPEVRPRETSNEDYLITIVVPAMVIAAMLLLAGCIACFLYRRKRKGKLSDEDQQTFINKGIPIIFADELEDKPDPPTKPLIMNEEKPPQPPPGYQRSTGGSVMSTPPSDHKEPFLDTEDDEDKDDGDMHSPPYRPPPPVTGSQGSRQPPRSHAQPPYRQPPPYVPP